MLHYCYTATNVINTMDKFIKVTVSQNKIKLCETRVFLLTVFDNIIVIYIDIDR